MCPHIQLPIHQYPQVFFSRAVLNPFIPQLVFAMEVASTQVQDLAFGLVELHEVDMDPPFKPVQVHLDGISSMSAAPPGSVSTANLLKVHSISLSMSPTRMLNSIVLPIPCPVSGPSIRSIFLQFGNQNVVQDSVKHFACVQIDDINCSSFTQRLCHFIIKGHQVFSGMTCTW